MSTYDLTSYDKCFDDLTSYDVYFETNRTRRIAAFSSPADACEFAKVAAHQTTTATRRVVVVARDTSAVLATFF